MIDTVILQIKQFDFQITNYEKFTPNCLGFFTAPYIPFSGQSYLKSIQNPAKKDSSYKPRLTVIKRIGRQGGFEISMKIEFSVPKLLYGNNFQEVEEKDFEKIVFILQKKLKEMSVEVSLKNLKFAEVSTIHYSKNFCFTDHTTASALISDISKVDLTRRLDLNKTDFRNDGRALYYYSKSHSLVFYDKIQDLLQPKSRSSEKDKKFNWQSDIFEEIRRKKSIPIEVLRMEMRICSKRKLKSLLKYLLIDTELNFAGLFKKKVAQAILLDYWCKIHEEVRLNVLVSRKAIDLLESIFKIPNITLQKALSLFAVLELSKENSSRKINNMISKKFCSRSFQRLKKFVSQNENIFYDRHTAYDAIYKQLAEFKPITKKDYSDLLL